MKTFKFLPAILLFTLCLTSCFKEGVGDIKTQLQGKWRLEYVDMKQVTTNDRIILNFTPSCGYYTSSLQGFASQGNVKYDHNTPFQYIVDGKSLTINLPDGTITGTISGIGNNTLTFIPFKMKRGSMALESELVVFKKMTVDYSKEICGLWEGAQMAGSETYGNADHRWEYRSNGTYIYYERDSLATWKKQACDTSIYFVEGNCFFSMWGNAGDLSYEWWDISLCDDEEMYWSAFRGSFTTSLRMHRVSY